MMRGIERRAIFRSDGDREDFLERLSTLLPGTKTGDSDSVMSVLSEADERLEHGYELRSKGVDLDRVARRAEEVLGALSGAV